MSSLLPKAALRLATAALLLPTLRYEITTMLLLCLTCNIDSVEFCVSQQLAVQYSDCIMAQNSFLQQTV
jgi:hypothetical protein